MEYHLKLPISEEEIEKLHIGDIIYISGKIFTARDQTHQLMIKKNKKYIQFNPSEMALYYCGPLMKKENNKWIVLSAGPTTSTRMEIFENKFIEKFNVKIIIGKGLMGKKTENTLSKHKAIYVVFTGGAGALAADKVEEVLNVYWLKELGMTEAAWIFKVKEFGPLVVAIDSHKNSIFKKFKNLT
ncbi:MAG: FumA C-terminus/TtdB family hydratase beta subunit [Candidatus Thermoplasmatota archaeon]|nr:FumA C-terminus/TtdB family hydratase beta subunit [Candidatus Thermoplasmatota archaeon]